MKEPLLLLVKPFIIPVTELTHWGRVTHICVSKLIIIGSDNGLSPSWRQAIIWTNAGILLIGPLGTNFSEILIEIYKFSFKRTHLKMSSGKWRPSCLSLNVLRKGEVPNPEKSFHQIETNQIKYVTFNTIQSGAIMMRTNMTQYCIHHCSSRGVIQIKSVIPQKTPHSLS